MGAAKEGKEKRERKHRKKKEKDGEGGERKKKRRTKTKEGEDGEKKKRKRREKKDRSKTPEDKKERRERRRKRREKAIAEKTKLIEEELADSGEEGAPPITVFGEKYEVGEVLGRGAFSVVKKLLPNVLEEFMQLKLLTKRM